MFIKMTIANNIKTSLTEIQKTNIKTSSVSRRWRRRSAKPVSSYFLALTREVFFCLKKLLRDEDSIWSGTSSQSSNMLACLGLGEIAWACYGTKYCYSFVTLRMSPTLFGLKWADRRTSHSSVCCILCCYFINFCLSHGQNHAYDSSWV